MKLTPIPKPESSCFACGQTNPFGLHMQFSSDGSRLYSTLTPTLSRASTTCCTAASPPSWTGSRPGPRSTSWKNFP